MNTLAIDTNILISALIKDSLTRELLTNLKINFIFPEISLENVYFYKEYIMKKAKLSEKQFYIFIIKVVKYKRNPHPLGCGNQLLTNNLQY